MSTRELARFSLSTDYEQLPAAAVQVAKQCILDTLGVAIAGAMETPPRILIDHARDVGGNPVARVWGHSFKTSLPYATLINGTSARALDLDDICHGWKGHPSAVLVPTLLTAADIVPMTGREAITSFVVGHAVGLCSNKVGGDVAFDRGWDRNTVNGCYATAALMGRVLKLDETQMSRAFGIASCGAFALMLSHGTHSTPYQEGYGGMTGVQAAMLAKRGLTAHEAVFETHPHGLADAILGKAMDGESFTAGLGSTWPIVDFDNETGVLCPKLYPACGAAHTSLEAVLGLIEEHDIQAEDVLGVTTETQKFVDELLLHRHRPTTGAEGKFSMEYSIAAALLDRRISIQSYTDAMVARPAAQELLRRVTYAHVPDDDARSHSLEQTVTIALRNGRSVSRTVEFAKGHPRNPLTWDDLVEKFLMCAEPFLGAARAAQVIDLAARLETLEDVRVFGDILS